jgi:hypothetical protein
MATREAMLPMLRSTPTAGFLLGVCLATGACDSLSLSRTQSDSNGGRAVLPPVDVPASTAASKSGKGARGASDGSAEAASFEQIRSSLRRLVAAEESFYGENGVYTEEVSRLGYRPSGGTDVRFLWLARGGWGASGTHPQLTGRNCVIFVGREHAPPATAKYARMGKEGVPVCDAAPPRAAPTNSVPGPGHVATAAAETSVASTPDTSNALDAIEPTVQMKVDLRNLARSQDTYLRVQGFYARRTAPFALQYLWHKGVTLTILSAGKESWSARATHVAEDGKSCVIWFGPILIKPTTWKQNRVSDQPLVPVCDD